MAPTVIATDDDSRMAGTFRWLGPSGWRFHRDHRGMSYAVAAGLLAAYLVAAVVFPPGWWAKAAAVLAAVWFANRHAKWVMARVDYHHPIRRHMRTARAEVNGPRPAAAPPESAAVFRPNLHVPHVNPTARRTRSRR